jgi:hypothetical protein
MTKQGKPQQPELRRSEPGRVDREHWKRRQEPEEPRDQGEEGPVPEENRPGHHPPKEQDKPE